MGDKSVRIVMVDSSKRLDEVRFNVLKGCVIRV